MSGAVQAIYVAARAGEEPRAITVASLEAGRGVVGDRYYDQAGTFSEKLKDSHDWEVTLIEREEIDRFTAAGARLNGPGSLRRNIVTTGIRLNELVGNRFRVGKAVLEGMRLCEPCAYLGGLVGPEVVKAMVHRAGLRARIIVGAQIQPGDEVG